MKTIFFIALVWIAFSAKGQNVPVLKYNQVEGLWNQKSDTVFVINFWATWCKPCVEELPAFYKIYDEYANRPFKMILVSLDFPQHLESRVIPFIEKNKIKPKVVLLDDDDNVWINKLEPKWDGSIPVTLIISKKQRYFIDRPISYEELKTLVESNL